MSGLTGMKDICNYMSRSESTVLMLIRDCDLPACKIGGGIWESDTELIDDWRKGQITKGVKTKKQKIPVNTGNDQQKPRTRKRAKKQ
ncbi:MAG: hypothetical protein JEZ12_27180 [Desulfobacterium sp.]|nr:hypothetical protein [Desulfobacterium sp.]